MLRPYQIKAIESIRKDYIAGISKQLLVLPTGAGKTVVFSSLPQELKDILPGQMMVLLHAEELAQQAANKLRFLNPNLKVGVEMGSQKADPSVSDIIVAGVGTLGRAGTKRLDKFHFENFDKNITDEAHRSIAQSYMNTYEAMGLLREDDKRLLLGVTATPSRADNQGLNKLYKKIVYTYTLRQAIKDGYLADIHGLTVKTKHSLDGVSSSGGEYNQTSLQDSINTPKRNQLVLDTWLNNASDRITIAFTAGIKHAQDLALLFQNANINAKAVWGDDPEREQKVQDFRDGKIQILFNAQMLVEGFDLDIISCVLLCSPMRSGVAFSQKVGRGTRLHHLKKYCLVIDMVDVSSRHSLTTLPTLMGLHPDLELNDESLLEAVEAMEEMQEQYPHLDLSGVKLLEDLESYIEEVNLFDEKVIPEIENNSQFIWHPAATGGYLLNLADAGELKIEQNLLDKYELRGSIKGKKYFGERETIEDVFHAADSLVIKVAPESLKIINKHEAWHDRPASPAQIKAIKKLYKGKQIPNNLTSGRASRLIGGAKARKGKK